MSRHDPKLHQNRTNGERIPYSHHTKNPDNPVDITTWFQAKEFCDQLNKKLEGVELTISNKTLKIGTEIEFDLPTEAQWEYACRAGKPPHHKR